MSHSKITLFAVAAALFASAGATANDGYTIGYSENIQSVEWTSRQTINRKHGDDRLSDNAQSTLTFRGLDRSFELTLSPNTTLTRLADNHVKQAAASAYRGTLNNAPNSWARISIQDGLPQGMIWDGQEMFALDIVAATVNAPASSKIFRFGDVEFAPGAMQCPDLSHAHNGAELLATLKPLSPNQPLEAAGAASEIQVGMLSDAIFSSANAVNVDAAVVSRMNVVDGIFSEQVGVQITLASIQAFDGANDPFTATTVPRDLLDELSDYRANNTEQRQYGLTHLFTGRNLDGSTVGIAWRRALCSRRFGSGLTQATRSTSVDAIIAAHEIGHNFGAPHDGEDGSACEAEPQTFLMAPRVNNSQTLSGCSLQQINSHVAQSSCITPLATDEIAITANSPDRNALLGDSVESRFTAINSGADTLTDVVVSVQVPSNGTLDSVTASTGSCDISAGTGTCTVNSLAQGAGVDITAVATTTAVGRADVIATVTASSDANSGNNEAQTQYTVDSAVDLAVGLPTSSSVNVDSAASVAVSISNLAPISATDVVVNITPDSTGVTISSATWSAGTCDVSATSASCAAGSIGANQTETIQVQVTGATVGTVSLLATAGSADTDRDADNNSDDIDITVSEAPAPAPTPTVGSGGDSGGGGAYGIATLLSLLTLIAGRRRRSFKKI